MSAEEKFERLKQILHDLESVVVAYSGGVDSTFLFRVAYDTLGERAVGAIGKSDSLALLDFEEAVVLAERWGARTKVISTDEMLDHNYASNPENRCYFCKSELFSKLSRVAEEFNIRWIVDGTNFDDVGDHRPGRLAAQEKNVRSPLLEAQLRKAEIRELSRKLGLPTWDKPEAACLASRIPHGTPVTPEALHQIERAELCLRSLGFKQVRVRHHETIARIETVEGEMELFFDPQRRQQIVAALKEIGYRFVTVDLAGYHRGSSTSQERSSQLIQVRV